MKKLLSLLLAVMLVFTVAAPAFAASEITKKEAKAIALEDAGYKESEVIRIKVERDNDDRVEHWDVSFIIEENGRYIEFDYEIKVSDGTIIEKNWEYEDDYYPAGNRPGFGLDRIEQLLSEIIVLLQAILQILKPAA